MRRLLALLAALTLLLGAAACSSSDDDGDEPSDDATTEETTDEGGGEEGSADESAYVEALMANLLEDTDSGDPSPVSEDEAECMAQGIVDTIGMDAIEESGVTPDELAEDGPNTLGTSLSDDQAAEIADAFVGCMSSPGAFLAAAMGAPADAAECLDENIDGDAFREFIAASLLAADGSEPPPEMLAMFEDLADACPDAFAGSGL